MAHRIGQKEESRARILAGAGRGFRSRGYGGLGVDGLAKEAGVTSGAFYAHFKSKSDAFREAVVAGLEGLRANIERHRAAHGADWWRVYIDLYLSERRTCDLADSCTLQSLTGEVARADDEVKAAYETAMRGVIDAVADGLEGGTSEQRRARAAALLALLSGSVSMARAVGNQALGAEIAASAKQAALAIAAGSLDAGPPDSQPPGVPAPPV